MKTQGVGQAAQRHLFELNGKSPDRYMLDPPCNKPSMAVCCLIKPAHSNLINSPIASLHVVGRGKKGLISIWQ